MNQSKDTTDLLKILLVEDNPADAKFLKITLEEEIPGQFEMVHETRLGEAIQTLNQGPFDLVLLDLTLPDETGFQTFHRMANAVTDVPIVVMTGRDDEELAQKALHNGAQDYLVKGQLQRKALLKSFRYALERHQSQKNSREQLESWALKDSLTDLLNRRGLQKAFLDETSSPDFHGSGLFSILLGVDNFKNIIDTLGRGAGDLVLKDVAQKLKDNLPGRSHAGWLQGDEFLVLLPSTPPQEAVFLADKIRAAIAEFPVAWSSQTLRVSVSVGVVMVPQTVSTLGELLNHAHFVLAQGKTGRKNKTTYSWDFKALGRQFAEEAETKQGPLSSRFYVASQPIYRLQDNRQMGNEFFIRTGFSGFEQPRDFFRLCLQANVMSLMDFQSFQACAASSATAEAYLFSHFNLFPLTLVDIPVSNLLECLPESRPHSQFCVEISSERIMGNPSYLAEPLKELRKSGVRLALDEVGFGYSCLESLLWLEPNVIKVAKGFSRGIENDIPKVQVMKRFMKMAESLGADLIVEGIQRQPEIEVLRDLGVPYGQGAAWELIA